MKALLFALAILVGCATTQGKSSVWVQPIDQPIGPGMRLGDVGGRTPVTTTPSNCTNATHTRIAIALNTSTAVPTTDLLSRRFVTICNSPENTGAPKVKCRSDGTAVTMGSANPGDPLNVGDCITYPNASGVQCNTDTASTVVTTYECQ